MIIVGVGNPVYDFISTPYVTTGERVLSGCSTNACLASVRLGAEASLVGCIGPDFGARFREDLERYGVQGHIFPGEQSGGFSLEYDARGDRTLEVLGIAPPIPDYPHAQSEVDFVLVGPILGETPPDLVRKIRSVHSGPILLDPQGLVRRVVNGRIELYRNPAIDDIVPLCDVVKANEHEANVMTGINPRESEAAAMDAARLLHEMGCSIAIVTLAAEGSVIFDGRSMYRIAAYTTNAVDPTGAGDTYAAGFMVRYLENSDDLHVVGHFASAVASVMVEHTGPDFPLTRAEADRRTLRLLNGT